jgi:hypothetical protein
MALNRRVTMPKLARILGNLGAGRLLAVAGMFFLSLALYIRGLRLPVLYWVGITSMFLAPLAILAGVLALPPGRRYSTRVLLIASFACTHCLGLLALLVASWWTAWDFKQHMIAS